MMYNCPMISASHEKMLDLDVIRSSVEYSDKTNERKNINQDIVKGNVEARKCDETQILETQLRKFELFHMMIQTAVTVNIKKTLFLYMTPYILVKWIRQYTGKFNDSIFSIFLSSRRTH